MPSTTFNLTKEPRFEWKSGEIRPFVVVDYENGTTEICRVFMEGGFFYVTSNRDLRVWTEDWWEKYGKEEKTNE